MESPQKALKTTIEKDSPDKISRFFFIILKLGILFFFPSCIKKTDKPISSQNSPPISTPTSIESSAGTVQLFSSLEKISIVATKGRELTPQGCDCSLRPTGGLHREWNLYEKKWGWPDLYFSVGMNFSRPGSSYKAKSSVEELKHPAELLAKALKQIRPTAILVTLDDLLLGLSFLEQQQKQSSLPFLSSNLFLKNVKTKSLFLDHLIIQKMHRRFLILGLTSPKTLSTVDQKMITLLDPKKAFESMLKKHGKEGDFVILLSNLSLEEQNKFLATLEESKKPNLLISDEIAQQFRIPYLLTPNTVVLAPESNSTPTKLNLFLTKTKRFSFLIISPAELAEYDKKKMNPEDKTKNDFITYQSEVLDPRFDTPKNPVSILLNK